MRVLSLLGVLAIAAACSAGVAAAPDSDCGQNDLACVLFEPLELSEMLGERISVEALPFERSADSGRWCDRVVPAPSGRVDAAYQATSDVDGSAIVMTVSAMVFDGADAEITTTAVSGLDQGCSWLEGRTSLQILDELETSDHGEELVGLLMRTEQLPGADGANSSPAENIEVVLIRRGSHLVQLSLFPAQDDALLMNEILTDLDSRLAGVAG